MNPNLTGIPETMLWTLHNRAHEAARADGCIRDEHCLAIYRALDYDYEKHFCPPDGSHGVRAQLFDRRIRAFLAEHPDGVIVNLGEGLETQRFRIDSEQALWISVDLPESIAIREQFIRPDSRHWHLSASALDERWCDAVPADRAVMITAQGLLMYFQPNDVGRLMRMIGRRFPGAILMFDYLNVLLSRRSTGAKGWWKSPNYRTPPMPWGVHRHHLPLLLTHWLGRPVAIHPIAFTFPRGSLRYLIPLCEKIPFLANRMPGICWIRLPEKCTATVCGTSSKARIVLA